MHCAHAHCDQIAMKRKSTAHSNNNFIISFSYSSRSFSNLHIIWHFHSSREEKDRSIGITHVRRRTLRRRRRQQLLCHCYNSWSMNIVDDDDGFVGGGGDSSSIIICTLNDRSQIISFDCYYYYSIVVCCWWEACCNRANENRLLAFFVSTAATMCAALLFVSRRIASSRLKSDQPSHSGTIELVVVLLHKRHSLLIIIDVFEGTQCRHRCHRVNLIDS